ncbi:formaldehyde-activating enzyme [Peribacillus simplex]|uniref:formaldehyde-activating enzyme n=1 Tax=Peribacillus simplex TaxID=1478 RepID=UPI0016243D8F|nr:formaldehyde-activating enzyme [Peribacillus simplex]
MKEVVTDFDGKFGEAFGGEAPNGSHINVVISKRGSNAHAESVRTLASPSKGHVPFLACLGLGNVIKPSTIVINKITIDNENYEQFFFGAAQLGIGQGVLDAVKIGLFEKDSLGDISLLVACWIDPECEDETKIKVNSRVAMFNAIKNALMTPSEENGYVQNLLNTYESATNNFYSGQ